MYRLSEKHIQRLAAVTLLFAAFSLAQAQQNRTQVKSSEQKTAAVLELIDKQEFAAASILIGQVIAAEPGNLEARTLAGVVAERQNDLAAAEKHFAIAVRLQPKSPEALNNYGAILFRLGRTNAAAKEFEASLRANPDQPSAQANLAQIYFVKGAPSDLLSARKLFEKVFAAAPDIEIARALVVIDLRLDERENAARSFQRYEVLAKDAALPAQARVELGASLLDLRLYDEAASELKAAVADEPNNVDALALLSRTFLERKDIKAAGQTLESAVSRGVSDAKIYAALADVYEAGGYFENAIPAMRLAVETDKKNVAYRYRYGMMLVDTKAPAAAVIRLKEAVVEFPGAAQVWLGLGIAQFYDSKLTDAQQSLEKALSLNSRTVPAFAYLAAVKNVSGQSAEAAALYKRALAIDDKSSVLHYLLAETLLKDAAADHAEVERHLKKSVEFDASIAVVHLTLGRLYARQKKFVEAAAAFEKTVALDANQSEAFYQLGQIYGRLKRHDEARAALAKFKELSEREKTQTKAVYSELIRRLANVKF